MMQNLRTMTVSLVLLGTGLFLVGCASTEDELGAEIRKSLGVTKDTLEKTENSVEKDYDPKVILKRAEAFYERGDYLEAVGEYQHFMDLHPLHDWADYALFKLGLTYFRQIRTIDRDPEPAQKALETFQKLISIYTDSEYVEEARRKVRSCHEILAKHQLYVGRFYYKKAAYPAAVTRFKELLDTYPDLPQAADALYYLGLTYYYQGNATEASDRFKELLTRYPQTPYRESVQKLLARTNGAALP